MPRPPLSPAGPEYKMGQHPSDLTKAVREYFLRHPGVVVWFTEVRDFAITQGLGHVPDLDMRIRNAINNSRQNGSMNIEFVVRGQSWIYRPNGDQTDPIEVLRQEVSNSGSAVSPISVINTIAGQMPKTASERLYREKMVTKSGDRVLEDEDGVLFRARELDLE